jgi:hypothetical protein
MTPDEERKRREAAIAYQKQLDANYQMAQDKRSIAAAIAYDVTKPSIERRRRAQAAANTPEAWAERNDFDVFDE